MAKGGVHPRAIAVFAHSYGVLASGETGMLAEIGPRTDRRTAQARRPGDRPGGRQGGDGRDRGGQAERRARHLDGDGQGQVAAAGAARARASWTSSPSRCSRCASEYDVALPVVFMDSFRTSDDTLAALAAHPGLATDGLPLDFLQNREPKLRSDDLTPVSWPADPSLEWCPPGHGDIYTALDASGLLRHLLDQRLPVPVRLQRRQPRRPAGSRAGRLVRRVRQPVRGRVLPPHRRRPQGRAPGPSGQRRTAGAAGIRADPSRGRGRLRRHQPAPVLQHQQPLARPGRAGCGAAGQRRRARPADHPQRQDRRPGRSDQPRGDPDRDRDGRGDRGVRGCRRDRGGPLPVPAGEGDQRPAGAAVRCLRADRRRAGPAGAVALRCAAGRPGQALQAGQRLRRAVPGRRTVADRLRAADRQGRLDVRQGRHGGRDGRPFRRTGPRAPLRTARCSAPDSGPPGR